jgi:hypothetical protein
LFTTRLAVRADRFRVSRYRLDRRATVRVDDLLHQGRARPRHARDEDGQRRAAAVPRDPVHELGAEDLDQPIHGVRVVIVVERDRHHPVGVGVEGERPVMVTGLFAGVAGDVPEAVTRVVGKIGPGQMTLGDLCGLAVAPVVGVHPGLDLGHLHALAAARNEGLQQGPGLLIVAVPLQDLRLPLNGGLVPGLDLQRPVELAVRLAVTALQCRNPARQKVEVRLPGLDRHTAGVVLRGLVVGAAFQGDGAPQLQGVGVALVAFQQLLADRFGLLDVARPEEARRLLERRVWPEKRHRQTVVGLSPPARSLTGRRAAHRDARDPAARARARTRAPSGRS